MPDSTNTWSTAEVDSARAFEYWRDLICDTFVQLSASPVGEQPFAGRIDHVSWPGLEVSTVRAGGQRVRRTPGLISRGHEAFLLASIQTQGAGLVIQDGRSAVLTPGSMAFYDSTRPYTLHFDDAFEQIVVQVPLDQALALTGARRPLDATARALGRHGPGGVVAGFFRSMTLAQQQDPQGTSDLAEGAGVLLASALTYAGGGTPPRDGAGLHREDVISYIRRHLDDPQLDIDVIAAALHVSRRTLFRGFAGEPQGIAGLLRRMRVERAQRILRQSPQTPIRLIAAECGFAGEVQFHRTFRAVTGLTPGQYRWQNGAGTNR